MHGPINYHLPIACEKIGFTKIKMPTVHARNNSGTATAATRPRISVILPTYNESSFVAAAINSLLRQQTDEFDLEMLVIDGKSTDCTPNLLEEIARKDSRVRVLQNPKRVTPAAFNIGLHAAKGDFVCLASSHCVYEPNYLAVCYRELINRQLTGCSGQAITRPAVDSLQARLVAWTLRHPFGTSTNSTRTASEGYTRTVSYPVFRKRPLLELGGYDESLFRNQDNDLNFRLSKAGHKLYLTSKTSAAYFPKKTLRELFKFAFKNGYWNGLTLGTNAKCLELRHLIPFGFLLALLLSVASALFHPTFMGGHAWAPLCLLLVPYFAASVVSALYFAIVEFSLEPLLLSGVFFPFHLLYGIGTIVAILRQIVGWIAQAIRSARRSPALSR